MNRELLNVSKNEAFRVRDDARRPRGRSGRGKSQSKHRRGSGDFGGATHPRFATRPIRRADMARVLQRNRLLPAICFIFSRVGCDAAVEQVRNSGVVLTSREEATQLGRIADRHVSGLSYDDLEALGYENFREALCSGVAAHHAGQLPVFKAIVEEGFVLGALKLVFATETLALGINMPARTVVLEKLIKYNGESHVDITPGEYTQLTGRAGRRGIDVEGHAVVLWQSGMDPRAVAGLASNRTYPLRSSFAPSYNMAVNLTAILGRRAARELLNQSFAQFQTDKSVVKAARSGKRMAEELEQAHETLQCHLGDFMEYARMRDEISGLESTSASNRRAQWNEQVTTAIKKLVPGDVIHVRKQGWCVVLRVSSRQGTCQVISGDHTVLNLRPHDLASFPEPVTRIRVPKGFDLRDRKARRSLLTSMFQRLEQIDAVEPEPHSIPTDEQQQRRIAELRRMLRQHPCHECEDRELHAVAAANVIRLERQTAQTEAKIASRTNSLAFQFDSVCAILSELGYVDGDQLTGAGRMLRRIYNELDLVAAECIQQDVFAGLDAPQLAAVLSTLLYESRPGRDLRPPRMPDAASEYAQSQLRDVWRQVGRLERQHRRERSREPDIGFAETAWRWASGQDLAKVMRHSELAPGDFVRWVRQVIDLAGQLAQAAGPGDLGRTCRQVIASMRRGVVAAEVDED